MHVGMICLLSEGVSLSTGMLGYVHTYYIYILYNDIMYNTYVCTYEPDSLLPVVVLMPYSRVVT